jgi:hypothetical protein
MLIPLLIAFFLGALLMLTALHWALPALERRLGREMLIPLLIAFTLGALLMLAVLVVQQH